jgi:hypothetical protein
MDNSNIVQAYSQISASIGQQLLEGLMKFFEEERRKEAEELFLKQEAIRRARLVEALKAYADSKGLDIWK